MLIGGPKVVSLGKKLGLFYYKIPKAQLKELFASLFFACELKCKVFNLYLYQNYYLAKAEKPDY